MEFLKNLISSFLGENGGDIINAVSSFLGANDFSNVMPVLEKFFSFATNKNPTENSSVGDYQGLSPVMSFADKDIVLALNGYLGD